MACNKKMRALFIFLVLGSSMVPYPDLASSPPHHPHFFIDILSTIRGSGERQPGAPTTDMIMPITATYNSDLPSALFSASAVSALKGIKSPEKCRSCVKWHSGGNIVLIYLHDFIIVCTVIFLEYSKSNSQTSIPHGRQYVLRALATFITCPSSVL
ncbi:unnamed protein product [Somion occarium]|uniref:Uncharacterized protein n=1 Tax=Somion occarium TaxID=3059160 RepID=A0ABP1CEP0_9APHY